LLGGNLGNVKTSFHKALERINRPEIKVYQVSQVYQSEPWGFDSEDIFYNQAVEVKTTLTAHELLQVVLTVETDLGRVRNNGDGYESRLIDIDILLFGNEIVVSQRLTVPHPRLHERNFALIPLADIAANVIHPKLKLPIATLVEQSTDRLRVWPI
jgi:2-amino-4-hydroxy-6-hydroxymethyldihydropteridine diphosphokinase